MLCLILMKKGGCAEQVLMNLDFRKAGPAEARKIVALHKSVYTIDQLRHTIFYSPRVARYIMALLSCQHLQNEHYFWGAWAKDRLIGYSHYRVLENTLHLNQIVVDPGYQGQGIGSRFIQTWKELAKDLRIYHLSLDVDESNKTAFDWYLRLGFRPSYKVHIYRSQVRLGASTPKDSRFALLDWADTFAWFQLYGFGTIKVVHQSTVWAARWTWQSLCVEDSFPNELLSALVVALANFISIKWVFYHTRNPQPKTSWQHITTRVRMTASVDEVK